MKVCRDCKIEKPLNEYYSSLRKDGSIYHKPECKKCTMIMQNKWKDSDREHYLEIRKKNNRTPKGKEDMRNNSKKWRESGRQLENQRKKKEKMQEYSKLHRNHKMSDKEWNHCRQYFNFRCAYCGLAWEDHKESTGQDLHKEHVDNNGANDLSNCVPSCRSCNSQKRIIEFKDWYCETNERYTYERYNRIINWLNEDYKKYIKVRK